MELIDFLGKWAGNDRKAPELSNEFFHIRGIDESDE